MFTLLTGPFHPSLETALVETIKQFKGADPQAPLAVVVPSEMMRRRVQWVLCAEHGLSLFHVSFLTFHQLVLRLQVERTLMQAATERGRVSIELVEDRWYEWMVPWLWGKLDLEVRSDASLYRSRGMRQAMWRTIRDLQEGQVDPAVGLRAVEEGMFESVAGDRLRQVFALQAAGAQWSRHLQVGLPDDLTQSILPWVGRSPFLSRQVQVLYYGFYDLTQIQLSLLEEVAGTRPVTVFFPLEEAPAFHFAQRFFERYLLKGGVDHQLVGAEPQETSGSSAEPTSPTTQVVSAVGEHGELLFACQTILHLVDKCGYAFHDIGIVARDLEPYSPFLTRLFQEYRIPFVSTATRAFLEDPWAKLWWKIAGLAQEEFPVQGVMDVLMSPYYRHAVTFGGMIGEHAHWWWRVVRHTRMIRGRADWERLAELAKDASFVQGLVNAGLLPADVSSEDVRAFVQEVWRLIHLAEACPVSGPVGDMTRAFETLFEKTMQAPGGLGVGGEDSEEEWRGQCRTECAEGIIALLRAWDRLGEQVTSESWVEHFRELVEEAKTPLPGQSQVGVQVMDAMSARGYGFRALLIVGLNDQVFPRMVREDAFLRDGDRRVLAESLGYKIDEKLQGLDEEALLFALLQGSARERLYLVYQRADHQGRPLIPSLFLSHDRPGGNRDGEPPWHVPLSVVERQQLSGGDVDRLTLRESRILALLQGHPLPVGTLESASSQDLLRHGLDAMAVLERSDLAAGQFDGLVEADHRHWRMMQVRGLSPTALERYVQCPLRFWMQEILETQEVREPVSRELPARVWGQLGHEVLHAVYVRLTEAGWPGVPMARPEIENLIQALIQEKALRYAHAYGTGYVMLWRDLLRRFCQVVGDMVAMDEEASGTQGWIPRLYEVEGTGRLPPWLNNEGSGLVIHGRVDRVDEGPAGQGLRVVDYKFSWSRAQQVNESDVFVEAGQGKRLQAPLYSWFSSFQGGEALPGPGGDQVPIPIVEFRFIRPFQSPSLGLATFVGRAWAEPGGAQLANSIAKWIQAMKQGQFFFMSGAHCRDCSWSGACRSQHHPSWSRAQHFPLAREFRLLKKQRITHE